MARARRGRKIMIAMVGLPARGKTFTARKLVGYLSWLGYPTRSFNVGEARRRELGPGQSHEFFDPDNADAERQRKHLAETVMEEALAFLRGDGRIAIYDATNSTRERRDWIRACCDAEDRDLLFVEISASEAHVEEALRAMTPGFVFCSTGIEKRYLPSPSSSRSACFETRFGVFESKP